MNSDLFKRLLKAEAENLYNNATTPDGFLNRIQPLINALEKENTFDIMSENDLETILVASNSNKTQRAIDQNSFFDIVDLSMYRAN